VGDPSCETPSTEIGNGKSASGQPTSALLGLARLPARDFVGKWALMPTTPTNKRGLYVSYNEGKNGAFDEAVEISNKLGCLTWLDASSLKPEQLDYPTEIFIRLTGQERYFRGVLLAIASADKLDADFVLGERNHRPAVWLKKNAPPRSKTDFQSVLFMSCLKEVPRPRELENTAPPQHPTYINL
jgi:hypothetical protein